MLNKKIILPFAAFAMASFVACGDDSSSSPADSSNPANNSNAPASVQTLEEAINLTCSSTENMCAKIYVEEDADTVQCNGTIFTPMSMGKPVEGCGNKAKAEDTPTDSKTETPAAEEPAAGNEKQPAEPGDDGEAINLGGNEEPAGPGAGEEPAGPGAGEEPAGPGAGEEPAGPGAGEEPATGTVGCMKAGVCSEGPAALASECSAEEGEELLDACPAGGEVCDIGEDGITMYFYADAAMSCDDYKAMIAAFSEMAQ